MYVLPSYNATGRLSVCVIDVDAYIAASAICPSGNPPEHPHFIVVVDQLSIAVLR